MYAIRSVSAAGVAALQRQLGLEECDPQTGRHLLDPLAERLGAFVDDQLVGMVRLLPLDERGVLSYSVRRMDGPFWLEGHADCEAPLLAQVLRSLPRRSRLWRSYPPPPVGEYSTPDIQIVTALQAIRKRPGMYVGGVGDRALQELIFEPISNTLDEHLAGHARHLTIDHDPETDQWTVADDGRGIPQGPLDRDGLAPIERAVFVLHMGPYQGDLREHVHAGRLGYGMVVLNALSARCVVESESEAGRFRLACVQGVPQHFIEMMPPTGQTGLRVALVPDPAIFTEATGERVDIRARMQTLACFNPGLEIRLHGEVLQAAQGLVTLAEHHAGEPLIDVRHVDETREGVRVRAVLGWRASRSGEAAVWSYCNQSETAEGGSHVQGARLALRGKPKAGRVLLVSVELLEPRFGGRTRDRLEMPPLKDIVSAVLRDGLRS